MDEELKKIFAEWGKVGGSRTKEKYGKEYFKKLAEKRWKKTATSSN